MPPDADDRHHTPARPDDIRPADVGSDDIRPADAGPDDTRLLRERTLHRVIAFSDAVVAIAMTLLVLPLVDVAQSFDARASVGSMLARNDLEIIAFVVSFLVVMRFWAGHRRLYDALIDYSEGLLSLNALWLLGVVFLPFPTARLFTQQRLSTGSVLFYLLTLLAIGLAGLAQTGLVWRRRAWIRSSGLDMVHAHLLISAATCGVFVVAAAVSLVDPLFGLLALMLSAVVMRPLRRVAGRWSGGRDRRVV